MPEPATDGRMTAATERRISRGGAIAAMLGLAVYATSAALHPGTAPHHTEAAFAHYASEPNWALIHLGELLGILLMVAALLALAWRLRRGVAGAWAALAGAAMVMFASVYAMFIAVDGVALGILVRRWADATPERQELLFEAAFAVRQIEAGLFGMQWVLFGIGAGLFALAFFASEVGRAGKRRRLAMSGLSVAASIGTLAFGITQARTGFSETSMAFQTGLLVGVVWIIAVALFLFRSPPYRVESGH